MIGIVQCLCPNKHAIYSSTYDTEKCNRGQAIEILNNSLEQAIEQEALKPECGACGAPKQKWRFQAFPTNFNSLDQALCAIDELKKRNSEQALYVM